MIKVLKAGIEDVLVADLKLHGGEEKCGSKSQQ